MNLQNAFVYGNKLLHAIIVGAVEEALCQLSLKVRLIFFFTGTF